MCINRKVFTVDFFEYFSFLAAAQSDSVLTSLAETTSTKSKPVDIDIHFSTQEQALTRFGIWESDSGKEAGGCKAMTNLYAKEAIKEKDPAIRGAGPTEALKNEKRWVKDFVREENQEIAAADKGDTDTIHHAFNVHHIPHEHATIAPGKLEEELPKILTESDHVLVTIPMEPPRPNESTLEHELYIGRGGPKADNTCRFFDANIPRGERKGDCSKLIKKFTAHIRTIYPETANYPSKVGYSTAR